MQDNIIGEDCLSSTNLQGTPQFHNTKPLGTTNNIIGVTPSYKMQSDFPACRVLEFPRDETREYNEKKLVIDVAQNTGVETLYTREVAM